LVAESLRQPRRSVTMNRLARAACIVGIAAVAVNGSGAQEQGAFRVAVDLVSISVSVTDDGHHHIGNLERDDFVVTENGVPQDVSFFARTGVPLALALLIDTSSSMQSTLDTAQEAAIGFVRHLSAADVATVVSFDSDVEVVQGFTNDAVALQDAIRRTRANGSTSLYNAVYIALKELNKTIRQDDSRRPRRRAIILLSDGDDTSSLVSFDEIIDLASRSDPIIYTIGLGRREATLASRKYEDGEYVLRKLAQQTGGRSFFPQQVRELAGVYQGIQEELSNQYSLGYESSAKRRDGKWRQIHVQLKRPGMTARTRQGYFAPPE
jgi:Ca-activated chloride channel family protein